MQLPRLAVLFCCGSAIGLAGSWSGALVDSKCYAAEQRNVNPNDTLIYVDRDTNSEIRYCTPNAKTTVFAVVQSDNSTFQLDAGGNARAANLVRATGKKTRLAVVVTGEKSGDIVKVDSIVLP